MKTAVKLSAFLHNKLVRNNLFFVSTFIVWLLNSCGTISYQSAGGQRTKYKTSGYSEKKGCGDERYKRKDWCYDSTGKLLYKQIIIFGSCGSFDDCGARDILFQKVIRFENGKKRKSTIIKRRFNFFKTR